MRRFGRKFFCSSKRRRYCAGLTLVAYLATAFGFPMPSDAGSSSSKAACCCDVSDVAAKGSCCCSSPKAVSLPSCCTVPHAAKHSKPDDPRPQQSGDNHKDVPTGSVTWVIGSAVLACSGQSTLWVSAGLVLPAPPPVAWQPQLVFAGWLPLSDSVVHVCNVIPPDPPPRLSAPV
jgi:hypothetical protein